MDDAVVARTNDGWALTRDEFMGEFVRVNPELPFEEASPELRQKFLSDVVNAQLLRGVAERAIANPIWE